MKKLLLLLFIPFVSFSQTFEDIMSINSIDDFKRVAIENGYEPNEESDIIVIYVYNLVKEEGKDDLVDRTLTYIKGTNRFYLAVYKKITLLGKTITRDNTLYDEIMDEIKTKCTYNKISKQRVIDYVTYKCSEYNDNLEIGFAINDGWGLIKIDFKSE